MTTSQLREVAAAGCGWGLADGDPYIIVVLDAGYDVIRLAWLLAGLPLVLCAQLRCGRVLYRVSAPKPPGMGGAPREHGAPARVHRPGHLADPAVTGHADTARYGTVQAAAWHRVHRRLDKDSA